MWMYPVQGLLPGMWAGGGGGRDDLTHAVHAILPCISTVLYIRTVKEKKNHSAGGLVRREAREGGGAMLFEAHS